MQNLYIKYYPPIVVAKYFFADNFRRKIFSYLRTVFSIMQFYPIDKWINWVDQLANDDYLIIDEFLSENLFREVSRYLHEQLDNHDFKKAGIGALNEYQIKSSIRGDFVYWLDKKQDVKIGELFNLIEDIISMLNRLCFLNLSGYEFHLAHYPSGSFYKKHFDQFKERSNRIITIIIYLNENWHAGDGGELKVYLDQDRSVNIEPYKNRCVIFKSDMLAHEVLLTNKSRYSLTGWLLHQPSTLGYLLG